MQLVISIDVPEGVTYGQLKELATAAAAEVSPVGKYDQQVATANQFNRLVKWNNQPVGTVALMLSAHDLTEAEETKRLRAGLQQLGAQMGRVVERAGMWEED